MHLAVRGHRLVYFLRQSLNSDFVSRYPASACGLSDDSMNFFPEPIDKDELLSSAA